MIFHAGSVAIIAEEPIWSSDAGAVVDSDLASKVSDYSHEKSADMGNKTASFTFSALREEAQDWLENGVGRHIVCRDGAIFWDGFVNSVNVTIGAESRPAGPMMQTINKIAAEYADITFDTNPPITLPGGITAFADDADAQEKYGILEGIVNVGSVLPDEATAIRDTMLQYGLADIASAGSISTGGSGISVTVDCVGYSELLAKYIYNYDSGGPTVFFNKDTKITNVLLADPGSRFNTDRSLIEDNLLGGATEPDYENENKQALTIIKDIVAKGDATDRRWVFGVTHGRRPYYKPVPTEVRYHRNAETGMILEYGTNEIAPWHVEAAENVLSEFVIPTRVGASADSDSVRFIERVNFSAPTNLTIDTGRVTRIAQYLARLGLGSI